MSEDSAAGRFWLELEALYQAAGRPALKTLVRLGREQLPPISISASAVNGWLNRKAVPAGQKNTRYLTVMVAFLQARVKPGTQYVRLPAGEWGRLLRAAQAERAAGRKKGRPRRQDRSLRSVSTRGPRTRGTPDRERVRDVPVASCARLIGRDGELAMLAGLVKEVAAGRGSVALVEGEPGIGKSALVQAAMTVAASLACQVFWGTGSELDQALPLQPLLDGLRVRESFADPRREAIARLLRGEAAEDRGMDGPAVLAEQLLALIAEECATRPTILVIDDLQWADQASIRLLGRLAGSIRDLPLLLVGVMRPVPQRDDLRVLRMAAGRAARLPLAGLGSSAVAELVAALAGGTPDHRLLSLAGDAAGNPLYITELVEAMVRSSRVTITSAGVAALTAGPVPLSLAAAIADRLGFISGPAREALQTASLLGVEFAVTDLAILLDRSVASLAGTLREACAAGVLAESGGRLYFRHPLIRTALYEETPAPVRAAWHREAARALAAAGVPADRVARQLLSGAGEADGTTEPIEKWMLSWLVSAADVLVSQAPPVAAALLARAVGSAVAGSVAHGRLTSRLANALYHTGDRETALQVASRALEHPVDPDLLVDLHWTLTLCRMAAGQRAESLAALDTVLASPGLSDRHRSRLLVLKARAQANFGELEEARRAAADALATAGGGGTWVTGWATQVLALVALMRGDLPRALALYGHGLAMTQGDAALGDLRLLFQINRVAVLGNLGSYEEALAEAVLARRHADQVGTTIRKAQAHDLLGQVFFETGRWDEALAEASIVPESLKEPSVACDELGIAALIALHRGDAATARNCLSAAAPHAQRLGHRLVPPLALAHSVNHEQRGALPDALSALTGWLDDSTEELGSRQDLYADAARLAMLTGSVDTADAIACQAAQSARELQTPFRQANALYCKGLAHQNTSMLLSAAEHYRQATRPFHRAMALEATASAHAHARNREQANAALASAAEIYTWLGATVDVARVKTAREMTRIQA